MKRHFILIILGILSLFTNCTDKCAYHASKFKSSSFIVSYYKLDEIKASVYRYDNTLYLELLYEAGDLIRDVNKKEQLNKKHSDLNFNYSGLDIPLCFAVNADFESIEIVSDKQFDASHPAGTLLSDIVKLSTISPYKYLKSGYQSINVLY